MSSADNNEINMAEAANVLVEKAKEEGGEAPVDQGEDNKPEDEEEKGEDAAAPQSPPASTGASTAMIQNGTFGVTTATTSETLEDCKKEETEEQQAAEEASSLLFVNQGLAAWERSRQEWLQHTAAAAAQQQPKHAVEVNVDEIIDVVFASPRQLRANGGKGRRNFPQPVALPQMVDILQDLWEAEGLDV